MTEAIYGTAILILTGISGFTARYMFLKIAKASELYAKEFVRVDQEMAKINSRIDLNCQKEEMTLANMKEMSDHHGNKLYDHGDKLAVILSRLDKIEFRIPEKQN